MDWNDLRYFVAVAQSGSTLAAGRALRVSQTTAARRIAALEQSLGLVLFERRQAGYRLTAAGEALLARAEAVRDAAEAFAAAAAAQIREVRGVVRLTAHEIFAVTVLAPILRDFQRAHPDVRVELDTSEALRDLTGGAADVALRSGARLEGAGLAGRRVGNGDWALYCSRDYAAEHGRPTRRSELAGHPLIGGGEEGLWRLYGEWIARNDLVDAVVMHHNSAVGLLSAVRAGIGLAVLPRFVGDHDPDLVMCLPPARDDARQLWLVTHERVRQAPHVRALLDFLGERLTALGRRN